MTEAQVGKELGLVQRQDVFDGFQFQEHLVGENDVGAVAAVEMCAVIIQWQIDLASVRERVLIEFMAQATFIGAFEQTRA